MPRICPYFLALIVAFYSMAATGRAADVYSYKDKDGVLQFATACVYFEKSDAKWSAPADVDVFGILYRTENSAALAGRLNEVVFSIRNASDRPLQCAKVRLTVRNPRREIIHQQESIVDVSGAAVPAGGVRQVRQRVGVDGFELNRQRGDVTIVLLSARFTK